MAGKELKQKYIYEQSMEMILTLEIKKKQIPPLKNNSRGL
jgi:hypothetical protein